MYASLAVIWGSSFLFIKVAVDDGIHPLYLTAARCAAGALTLLVVLAVRRVGLPRGWRLWGQLALLAFVGNVLPFTLFGFGEQRISSILAGIWNGTTPLAVLLVVLAFVPAERPTKERVAGLLLGFAGVLIVLGVWHGVGKAALVGQLMCLAAAVCYGFAIPYTRTLIARNPGLTGVSLAAGQLAAATVELAVVAPLLAGKPPAVAGLSLPAVLSVLALGAIGTGIAFMLNFRVIKLAGATTASTVTYLVPVFSTLIGIVVLHEQLAWYEPVGALVVLLGVAISQGALRPRRTAPVPVPPRILQSSATR
jgi:drug/metabolite transporter (DMT)-like permease